MSSATRTKVRVRDDEEEERGRRGDELNDVELEREKKLKQWRSEFVGDGYNVRIHRWDKDEKKWEHLDTLEWDSFDIATLRKWVIGKSSRFRLTLLDEKKNYVEGGRVEELVANPDWKEGSAAPAAPVPPPEDPLKNPIVQLVIENQKAQQTQLLEMFKIFAGKPAAAGPDPLDLLVKMKQLFPEQKSTSMKEMAETLVALRELAGDGGGASDSWISEIKEGVSLFAQVSELAAKKKAARVPLSAPTPAAAPQLAPVPNPPPGKEPVNVSNPIVDVVRTYIPILVRKAEAKAPIDEVAEFLLAELESDVIPVIRRVYPVATEDYIWSELLGNAKNPEKVSQIFGFAPELAPYDGWIREVIAEAVRRQEAGDTETEAHA